MAHRSFLAVAFAGFGLLACGAGDTAGTAGPVLDQSPSPNPNQPVTDSQRPGINPNQPGANPNQPGSGSSGGGTPGEICDALCNEAVDCLNLRGQPGVDEGLIECSAECSAELDVPPACAAVVGSFMDCLISSGALCDLFQDVENPEPNLGAIQACQPQATAIQACAGVEPEPPDMCTFPNCGCDGDLCEACVCLNEGDDTLCAEACALQ